MMIALVVTLLGYVAVERLAVDLLPKLDYPTIRVETLYRGAAPEEIETLLTRPLEQALSAVKGSEELSSVSAEGASTIRVRMTWGADLDVALNDMRQAVQRVRRLLPEEVEGPFFRRYDESDSPIIYLGLERKREQAESQRLAVETTRRAETEIVPELEKLEGVGHVRIRGAVRREIQVDLARQKLESLHLGSTTWWPRCGVKTSISQPVISTRAMCSDWFAVAASSRISTRFGTRSFASKMGPSCGLPSLVA